MKKYWKQLLLAAIGFTAFTACEDVPEPYNIPTEDDTPTPVVAEPTGTGTLEDPFNAAAANQAARTLESGAESEQDYYIKGVVSSVAESYSTNFGNASFYISEDGSASNQFYVYRALYLGNQKYTSGENIEAGDTVIVCGKITNYRGNTPETVQNKAYLYSLKKGDGAPVTPVDGLVGSGTIDDPYTSASAILLASALSSGAQTSEAFYIKGKVVSVKEQFSAQYGNASFYISDDGTTTDQFYVFRTLYLGNQKWSTGDKEIQVGDEVIICAKLTNYMGNTPETVQGATYLYSLNGETGGVTPTPGPGGDATGDGTLENPYNSVAANNIAAALAADAKSDGSYYIKGKVVSVRESYSAQYGNASFYISDGGTTAGQFYVFRALYLGNQKWVSGNTQIKVGDEVIVYAQLTNYKGNTPETVQGATYLYSLNGKTEDDGTGGGEPTPEPGSGTKLENFTNGDFETWADGIPTGWQSTTTASTKNALSQSTDAHGGQFSVCLAGDAGGNKRMAYKELDLEAGTYTFSFYVKPEADGGSVRPGYVPVTDGKVGTYMYGDYTNDLPAGQWTLVTHTFTLDAKTTVNLVIMNPKKPGKNVLIDDFTIVKN